MSNIIFQKIRTELDAHFIHRIEIDGNDEDAMKAREKLRRAKSLKHCMKAVEDYYITQPYQTSALYKSILEKLTD